jgi:hypothetical protein
MLSPRLISRLRKTDWDFAGRYSESPFSSIHWYPGRFVSQLPATFIGLLTPPGGVVLDPFVGSGTTLVEAQRLGRRGIGIDLNPIACLITRAKTLRLSAKRIEALAATIASDAEDAVHRQMRTHMTLPEALSVPPTVQGKKWYPTRVLDDLGRLWTVIQTYRTHQRILALTVFSAILLPVCRESRHWGYVCDNSEPDGKNAGDVLAEYLAVLERLRVAYAERDRESIARTGSFVAPPRAIVICKNAIEGIDTLPTGSVDLVVTSPPYFGVSDYTKAQRLSMEWLSLDIEPLRLREIGARSKRHRARAADDYVRELRVVFDGLRRVLKPGGSCVVVVGESATRGSVVADVRHAAGTAGFGLAFDVNRRVSSQRRQAPSIHGEHLLIFGS